MIVTEEGKNIYPEDIETAFEGLPVKEFCVFAANYLWPARTMVGEKLCSFFIPNRARRSRRNLSPNIAERNRRLLNYKRISGYLALGARFPAHRVAENQTRRIGRANSASVPGARPWCRCDTRRTSHPQESHAS